MTTLLVVIALIMLTEMGKSEIARRRCAYCGQINSHRQDCPMDHLEQNS